MTEERKEVVVVDVKIPFWSMVVLLVKWALAAIPAILILFSIAALLAAIFGGTFNWNVTGRSV